MVDLQATDKTNCRKGSDGKVKILMDRTPSFLKSKFLSVLGSSNDLINGLTTKVFNNCYFNLTPNNKYFSVYSENELT